MYALTEMNISKWSETWLKVCVDIGTYSAAKDPLPFILNIMVDADSATQSYHIMKQLSGETTTKYRIRMED